MAADDSEQSNQWNKCLQQMQGQTQRMPQLVEDLLMLSRLENEDKTVVRDSVAVPALLASLVENADALSGENQHRISLESDDSLRLRGSEKELTSAFSNLLFNAVQYTPDKGHIIVRWYRDGDNACFEVQDDGIGIAIQHVHRLTERFYRVDAGRSREHGGTGLGLAIVKHVLDRHEAWLGIESQPGKGSVFRCTFSPKMLMQRDASTENH